MDSGEEKVLIIGMDSEADTLDPMRFNGWVSYRVTRTIHESLVTEDLLSPEDQVPSIQPELAKEWDVSEDGMTYTFYLEEDVYFHDGTPFNADAVEFNVRRAWDESFEYFDPNSAANLTQVYGHVKGVRAIDEHSVEFTLNQPYSPFIRMLAIGGMGSTGIASPKAIRTYGNDGYAENPSGTGPFKYDARVMSERIEVVANDQYWREIPELDRVIFRPIPDDSARTMALQSGAVDSYSDHYQTVFHG
ncbi:dipeptide-binding ABC transporter, periplasmic substrate-binding component [Geomicrobium sp. JCM 19037]|nr:dipeptide-binding ABC transporter, periplasmic substrate-binding component [Geomicrobium sp. JCM 19037]